MYQQQQQLPPYHQGQGEQQQQQAAGYTSDAPMDAGQDRDAGVPAYVDLPPPPSSFGQRFLRQMATMLKRNYILQVGCSWAGLGLLG